MKQADKKYIEKEVVEFLGDKIPEKETKNKYCGFETMGVKLLSPLSSSSYPNWVNAAYLSTFITWNETGDDVVSQEKSFEEKEKRLLDMLKSRPISVATECVKFTFAMENVSRAVTHQIVRHRKMAFGQQSLRVSDPAEDYIRLPQVLYDGDYSFPEGMMDMTQDVLDGVKRLYANLVKSGVPREQARAVLPIGICTKINATMSLRAMIEYFRARTSDIAMAEHTHLVALMAQEMMDQQYRFYNFLCSQVNGLDDIRKEYLHETMQPV